MAGSTSRGPQTVHGTQSEPETKPVKVEDKPEEVAVAGTENPVRENADYPAVDTGDPDSIAAFKAKMADPAIREKYGLPEMTKAEKKAAKTEE